MCHQVGMKCKQKSKNNLESPMAWILYRRLRRLCQRRTGGKQTKKGTKTMIKPTPPFPIPMATPSVLPILGAVALGFAVKAIWDSIFE